MKRTSFCLAWVFVIVTNVAVLNSSPLHGKITNSQDVTVQEDVSYMASIRLLKNEEDLAMWYHICGGCLISLRHILTAAQCIILINEKIKSGFEAAAVFVGTLHLDDSTEPSQIEDMEYNNKYNPENFHDTTGYDIGVILLMEEVRRSDRVKEVDLYDYEGLDVGIESGMTLGWGALQRSSAQDATCLRRNKLPSTLRFASMDILDDFNCVKRLRNVLNYNGNLMCASNESPIKQTSVGDAGNPLITKYNDRILVAGVASYISKSDRKRPNVFVRVQSHRGYIHEAKARLLLEKEACTGIASSSNNIIATH